MGRLNENYKTLDFIFRNEYNIICAVEKIKRREFPHLNASHLIDPTATTALRNLIEVKFVKVEGRVIQSPEKWLEIIIATYEESEKKNKSVFQVAQSRFRFGEFYLRTCFSVFISVPTYYRMLNIFFRIAERVHKEKMRID